MDDFELAAERNVEHHLGDVVTEEHTLEEIAAEVYTLAHDGAVNAGASPTEAKEIATLITDRY